VPTYYSAYLDESYQKTPSLISVAGYIVKSDQVLQMSVEWANALKEKGLPFFHMVDFAHRKPPFDKLTRAEIDATQRSIFRILKRHALHGFSVIANTNHFKKTALGEMSDEAYSLCLHWCMTQMASWLIVHDPGASLSYYIENGNTHQARAGAVIGAELQKGANSFGGAYLFHQFSSKMDVRLLQAADILAWQSAKHVKDHIKRERAPRKDFLDLVHQGHSITYISGAKNEVNVMQSDLGSGSRKRDARKESVDRFMDLLVDDPSDDMLERWVKKFAKR
jgi:hypothetical protein